jgi:uncharacterized membrane protein YphA (DoxX/SURF4 family)
MLACSVAVIAKRYPEYSVGGLLGVVVAQGFGYGLIFDLSFFLRNLSVVGGLLMVLSDSLSKRKNLFAGLPQLSEDDRRHYFQLAGRVLLVFLFLGFVLSGQWSFFRVIVSIVGLGACVMVAVGFKAKWSALFLVMLLSIFNVLINNWWSVHSAHPQRDFLKYDFFQVGISLSFCSSPTCADEYGGPRPCRLSAACCSWLTWDLVSLTLAPLSRQPPNCNKRRWIFHRRKEKGMKSIKQQEREEKTHCLKLLI